jgi:hypothetical protein
VSQKNRHSKNLGEKEVQEIDRARALLKKLAVLEDIMLIGNKVYAKGDTQRIANVLLQGKVTVERQEVAAGESFALVIEIANLGHVPATLNGIEETIPCCGLELTNSPSKYNVEGSYLD